MRQSSAFFFLPAGGVHAPTPASTNDGGAGDGDDHTTTPSTASNAANATIAERPAFGSAPSVVMAGVGALVPGAIFADGYRIHRRLSARGMGAVYVAEQLSTGALRALKTMHPQLVLDVTPGRFS